MSNDNFAIQIDPPDDVEYDIETGFNSSTCHLMHNFEEERPTSLVASIRESAISSKRKVKYYCSFFCSPIKKLLSTFKLLIIIGLYSFIGAHLFMYLEVPTDLEAKEDGFHQRKIAREVMVLNLRAIYYDNRDDREERWKHAILKFEEDMGLEEPVVETVWTFWMSFLYAGTIFTTIGYGNIACKTRAGQIATMVYAFVGIPIMLVMLTSLNNFLLKWIKIITNGLSDILLYIGVRLGITVIRQDEVQKRLRYTKFAKKMKEWKLSRHGAPSSIAISSSEENRLNSTPEDDEEEEMVLDPPVLSTLFATVAWIMLSAAVFCLFEDWTFFTSFYFCFISLTTIGLGDVTPANPEYMIATFGVVIVGLSMLTVCIDVIKEKLAQMYMALLQKLLQEYMEAVKSGDPNAASAMMAGFQGRAKFLMPLISKNEGAKVMDKFKQDCTKKGIDPPPVLTNINPETGMPAFANAPREDFRDYIDVAQEMFAEEQQKLTQTPLSKSTDFFQSPTPRPTVTVAVTQTSSPPPTKSLEVQAGTTMGKFHDYGSQTQTESSDEGIQTDYSMDFDDEMNKEPKKVMADAGTQYEIVLLTSIGIQPEVSSIYIGAEQSDHSDEKSAFESEDEDDFSEYSSSDDESELKSSAKYKETSLPFEVEHPGMMSLGLQSPPIEITPFSDDESALSEARSSPAPSSSKPTKLSPPKFSKSASIDSTETVIHVKPEEKDQEKKEKEEEEERKEESTEEKKKRRKKRKRMKTKKTREHELRFLKNSGNQTSPVLMDCSTQYEVFTTDSGSQYDVKGRSRKCQTKLSSINHEQLQGIRETVQKLKRRESEMSRVSNVSESDWDSEAGRESEVAEISLDLSVVALGVDETGRVVEVPKPSKPQESLSPTSESLRTTSESTSAEKVHLDSEDEEIESLEELELYTTDAGMQTEPKMMVDQQDFATPKTLDIIKTCSTQTTFSTFHLPQKVYESASTSSDEEDVKSESGKDKKSENEVFFMTNAGVQTMHTSFHLEEKPKIVEEEKLQKVEETDMEEMPLFLKNSECQTLELEMLTCSTSTEDVRFVGDAETSDGYCQTVLETKSLEVQTLVKNYLETTMQTEDPSLITDACQTESIEGTTVHSQTDTPNTRSFICQTESIVEPEVTAVPSIETVPVECQTEMSQLEEVEVQTEIGTSVTESQTDNAVVGDVEMQTESTETITSESQTEKVTVGDLEMQTDQTENTTSESQTEAMVVDDVEMQTEQVETIASESQTEQLSVGDIEMQTDEKDTFASTSQTEQLPIEFQQTQTDEVTFSREVPLVDQITQSESAEFQDSETQYTLSIEDRDVQATPISFETQTQHSIEIEVKSCQTEGVKMKNKKSQVEDDSTLSILKIDNESQIEVDTSSINLSPIRLDVSHSFTMTEPGASEEKEVQVDEDCFEREETSQRFFAGPLWSDFDYTPEFGDEDEEVVDGETQTQDGSEPKELEVDEGEEEEVEEEYYEEVEVDDDGNEVEGGIVRGVEEMEDKTEKKAETEADGTDASPKSEEDPSSRTTKKFKKVLKKRIVKRLKSKSEAQLASAQRSTDSLADSVADEFAVQCSPESSDIKIQTVKFKKKKKTVKTTEPKVEMSTSTVQATTEMCEQSSGDVEDDWLQVYVQELDEERRMRMSDIGIQTGVLARVQHIYTRPISDDAGSTSSTAPITLRKSSDSDVEHVPMRTAKSSEESLAPSASGTAISAAESMDDRLWPERASPFASRHSSLKRRKKEERKTSDKTNIVQDLRARFESKSPAPKSPPKEEGEGSSSDPKQFF